MNPSRSIATIDRPVENNAQSKDPAFFSIKPRLFIIARKNCFPYLWQNGWTVRDYCLLRDNPTIMYYHLTETVLLSNPPKTMAPVLPLPNGKASSQATAGLLYHNLRSGSLLLAHCSGKLAIEGKQTVVIVDISYHYSSLNTVVTPSLFALTTDLPLLV